MSKPIKPFFHLGDGCAVTPLSPLIIIIMITIIIIIMIMIMIMIMIIIITT